VRAPRRILLFEDRHNDAQAIQAALAKRYPAAEVIYIKTELEFRQRYEEEMEKGIDLAILDVMARWTDPAPDMQSAPTEVREDNGYQRAGFRCSGLLLAKNPNLPILLCTILPEDSRAEMRADDGQAEVFWHEKQANYEDLMRIIQEALDAKK